MTEEIRNPAKLPTDLNPVEEKFVRCLAEGIPRIVGNGELPKEGIASGDNANVVRSEVVRFFAYGGNEENPVLGPLICLRGAWISGDLNLMYVSIPYVLLFHNCHFDAVVGMAHTKCAEFSLNGSRLTQRLFADGLTTKGDVNLCAGFSAEDEVRLLNANIGGNFNCVGGKFHNPKKGRALSADKATVKGDVNLCEGFSAKGEVWLMGANIGGDLSCNGGKFNNPGGKALVADRLTTKGGVFLRMISAKGEVRLPGASIGGDLDCDDGKFHNPKGDALSAGMSMVEGDVNLRDGFSAEGTVRMSGASIGGDFGCVGGKFHNPDGDALHADAFKVKGGVHLQDGFSASGDVRLLNANISGDLSCTCGTFHNPGKNALFADKSTVKGDVNLIDGFSAEGEVRLVGMNIGGNLNCMGGKFNNPKGNALNIDSGNISRNLLWWKTTCKGNVLLTYAEANVLADDPNSWKSCMVDLEGFTYNRFFGPVDAPSRINWLSKRPGKMEFSLLPYEQAAKVLFGMGHSVEAWDILREKRRLEREHSENSWLQRVGGWMIDTLTDFVYRPLRTVKWTAGIVLMGAILFGVAGSQGKIAPHQPAILSSGEYQDALDAGMLPMEAVLEEYPEYPEFNFLAFSLDVFIPLFSLHQESFWAPASSDDGDFWKSPFLLALSCVVLAIVMFLAWLFKGSALAVIGAGILWGPVFVLLATVAAHFLFDAESALWFVDWRWLTVWYWIEIIAGWLLSSLLLLSVTGLLRPRIGSGD